VLFWVDPKIWEHSIFSIGKKGGLLVLDILEAKTTGVRKISKGGKGLLTWWVLTIHKGGGPLVQTVGV